MSEVLNETMAERRARLERSRHMFDGTEAPVFRDGDEYVHDLGGFTIRTTGWLRAGDGVTLPPGIDLSRHIMSPERYATLMQEITEHP